MSTDPGIWVAAILTLAVFSFLYRENPVFRFAEHLLVADDKVEVIHAVGGG